MRFARITLGLLLALSGLVATVAGAVAAFWLVGPDNTITTPQRELAGKGLALVSSPELLDRHGPTLHVSVSGDKPLFVGVAQDLDVRDYLAGVAHTQVTRFGLPATFGTEEVRGRTNKLTPPGELDWWVAQSAAGAQSLSWPVQDGRYDVVVMNADGTPAVGAQVTFGLQVHRLFGLCLLVLGAGVLALAFGVALLRRRRPARDEVSDTREIPVINTRIPALASAELAEYDEELGPAYRVSPFHPDRVSPFAPLPEQEEEPAEVEPAAEPTALPTPAATTTAASATTATAAGSTPTGAAASTTTASAAGSTPTGAAASTASAEAGAPIPATGSANSTPARAAASTSTSGSASAATAGAAASTSATGAAASAASAAGPARLQPVVARSAPAVPAAPMFMSAAAVQRAKAPVLIGAGARHEEPPYGGNGDAAARYDEPARPERAGAGARHERSVSGGQGGAANSSRGGESPYGEQVGGRSAARMAKAARVDEEIVPLAESPEYVKSDEAVRRTAALLASGALLLTTTSCGLLPPKNSLTVPDARPAVTLADAQAVVQRYNQLNNQANRTRDSKISATIEGNPTLAQTQAGFAIGRKLDAAGKEVPKPFSYTNPQIGAPQFASYPMRFVVSSGVSDAPGSRQLGVWQRQNAGAPWLLTRSVYPAKTTPVPSLDGLRTPDTADLNLLRAQPDAVAKDLAAYLTGGVKAPQAKSFAASPSLKSLLDLRAKTAASDTAEPYIASVNDAFLPSGTPLSFITSNGDALVFLSLTEQYLQRVEPGSNAYWTSGEATAFSRMVKYTQSLHQDYLHQVALVIPTKESGKQVQVLSVDPQLVGAGGV
ncbi:hypothetical protein ACFV9C_00175 [Kribbella sp. NPDC059898]|uniref:hypothetical protein n=1 Tax=Kribbella sp. NPDC059898 TaxID=3346995 RepID=UPI00364A1F3A